MKLVTYTAKPEHADENERLIRAIFAELASLQPDGVSYAVHRAGDTFVHLADPAPTGLASFRAFTADHAARCLTAPVFTDLSAVAAYPPSR
jgi:hypothetical protein